MPKEIGTPNSSGAIEENDDQIIIIGQSKVERQDYFDDTFREHIELVFLGHIVATK